MDSQCCFRGEAVFADANPNTNKANTTFWGRGVGGWGVGSTSPPLLELLKESLPVQGYVSSSTHDRLPPSWPWHAASSLLTWSDAVILKELQQMVAIYSRCLLNCRATLGQSPAARRECLHFMNPHFLPLTKSLMKASR